MNYGYGTLHSFLHSFLEDIFREGEVGGHCEFNAKLHHEHGDHKSPLQSWWVSHDHGDHKSPVQSWWVTLTLCSTTSTGITNHHCSHG